MHAPTTHAPAEQDTRRTRSSTRKQSLRAFFFLSSTAAPPSLVRAVLEGFTGVHIQKEPLRLRITAPDIATLKRVQNFLHRIIEKRPLLIGPARAFLLEQGVYKQAHTQAQALSQILCVNEKEIPALPTQCADLFLENARFLSGFPFTPSPPAYVPRWMARPRGAFHGLAELDVAPPLASALVMHNLSYETLNCTCCTPNSYTDKNVLSNSQLDVAFNEDGFYFETALPSYAHAYHASHPGKKSRLRRQREYALPYPPIGPLFSDERRLVPLCDATTLFSNQQAKPTEGEHSLLYTCARHQGALTNILSSLLEQALTLEKTRAHQASDALFDLLGTVMARLATPQAPYYHAPLGQALEGVEARLRITLKEKAEQTGHALLYCARGRALVRGRDALSLSKALAAPGHHAARVAAFHATLYL